MLLAGRAPLWSVELLIAEENNPKKRILFFC